jgi:hypothetical protein
MMTMTYMTKRKVRERACGYVPPGVKAGAALRMVVR